MTAWEVLGIPRGADPQDIKAAYRRRMMECHPDKGGSEEEAKMVNKAYELLTKPELRPTIIFQRPVRTYVRVVFTTGGYSGTSTSTNASYFTW